MKRSITRGLYFVALALALTALAYWAARTIPGAIQAATHTQSQSKEEMLNRMSELELAVADLKQQVAKQPRDESLRSQLEAAIQEYDQLSQEMGGDRAPSDAQAKTGPSPSVPEVVPPSPPGCTATTTTFTQPTPVPIPDNNTTGASSIFTVAGAGTYVWDVNVTVNITHTFAADLDFTLTSPSGTVVTLSTDNGGGNDNVFNGTTFDDQANPGSQIPYATQPNQVVDNTYANNVVAVSLTPEEPLSAFNGSDPNGTWTLKVVDDLGGDSGTINSWSMEITTFPAAPTTATTVASNSTPVPIPDNNTTGATSTIAVAGAGTSTCDVNVTVNIPHTFAADLDFTLTSPSGKIVTLSTDNGGANDNVFNGTTFDDQADPGSQIPYAGQPNQAVDNTYANNVVAASLTPEEPLALFNGDDPNGTWTLKVVDDLGGDSGTINSWSLTITTCTCAAACTIQCPPTQNATTGPGATLCCAVVNYPAPTTTGTCGTVNCSPVSGSCFPVGTTTVTCRPAVVGSCSFLVVVVDNTPPTITCPQDIIAVGNPGDFCVPVNFTVTASDNCAGVTIQCVNDANPSQIITSGFCFPVVPHCTTVRCTATDASANTATCTFNVCVFDVCMEDDASPCKVLLFDSFTGDYIFCCCTFQLSGTGTVKKKGGTWSLTHTPPDRRLQVTLDILQHRGTANLQFPVGTQVCSIQDRDTRNNSCQCGVTGGQK